jgi:hypothetical protein
MCTLNDGGLRGWQSSDLHYANSLFYGTQTRHRNALICYRAFTALSLFAKSITTNIQRVLERVSCLVSCFLQFCSFNPANKGLRVQNNTVLPTVGAKITLYLGRKKPTLPLPPIALIEGGHHKNILQFSGDANGTRT